MLANKAYLDDLDLMRSVAIEAGNLAQSFLAKGELNTRDKVKDHPVTDADIAVNTLIEQRLRSARPDYGWLSEETALDDETRKGERVWVVDPIDGTKAFIKGEPYWCIGVGLIEQGRAVAGVVHAPQLGETYTGALSHGAFLNGQPITASQTKTLEAARLVVSAALLKHSAWPQRWPDIEVTAPKPNATLLRICWVASGAWDGAFTLSRKSDWDLVPGAIIAAEAGALATTHLGEEFLFNRSEPAQRSLLVAGKAMHSLLSARLKPVRLPDPNWTVRRYEPTPDAEPETMAEMTDTKQLLHIVIGGELKDVTDVEFEDLSKIDFVGAFPSYKEAYDAWKNAAQRTVDNAEMRYFILHAHKLLDPETGDHHHV